MRFQFHPEARAEYREAALFYARQRRGLGVKFAEEIETAISQIVANPRQFRIKEEEVRCCLTRRFPYALLYTIEPERVLIVAVMHGSREPGYWKHRR
jgi:toxin ParE1/3/4